MTYIEKRLVECNVEEHISNPYRNKKLEPNKKQDRFFGMCQTKQLRNFHVTLTAPWINFYDIEIFDETTRQPAELADDCTKLTESHFMLYRWPVARHLLLHQNFYQLTRFWAGNSCPKL